MTNSKRDIFAELTEGFDALKAQGEGKLTLRTTCAPTRERLKIGSKVARQTQRPGLLAHSHGGAISRYGAAIGGELDTGWLGCH
jgi:hypothetical protein